jgi:hypothetical protein
VKILLLAPHPFYQARGTPIAVKSVLEFLSERGDSVDVLTYSEGADVEIPNCRVHRIPRVPGLRNIRAGFSFKKVICDVLMVAACLGMMRRTRYDLIHARCGRCRAFRTSTTWTPPSPSRWSTPTQR